MSETSATPPGFTRYEYTINGVRTVLHIGGRGRPVVYWHGAGSWHGFDFAQSWLDRFQVIVPSHPGWGESADEPAMDSMYDYVLHYRELFETLGLREFDLVGFSLGGWMAAEFAVLYRERLRRLVLVAPAGLADPEHPGPANIGSWSLDEMYSYLVSDRKVLQPHLPQSAADASVHAAEVRREMQSTGRLAARGPFNPKLERWLHRVTVPTLLVWSKADRLAPVGRSRRWLQLLADAQLALFERAGHLVLDELPEAREVVARFLA